MKKNKKHIKTLPAGPEAPAFRFNTPAAISLAFGWFALCLYSFAKASQFISSQIIFVLPSWLQLADRYGYLVRYAPQFLWLAAILASAFLLGRGLLKLLRADSDLGPFALAALACSAGLGAMSYLTLLAGVLGELNRTAAIAIIAAPLALIPILRCTLAADLRGITDSLRGRKLSLTAKALLALLAFSALTAFFNSLTPEIFFDALFYHLGMPNFYVREGAVVAAPWNLSSAFPYLMHMLYALALAVSDGVLAKLLHYATGLLLAVTVFSFAARFSKLSSGILAAAIFFCTPMVVLNWSVAGVEIASALFTFAAVFSLVLLLESPAEGRTGPLLRAALFTGLACSTKYPAFFTGVAGAVLLLLYGGTAAGTPLPGARRRTEFLIYSAVVLLVVSPWLIKNLVFFGNPLYPFLGKLFGAGPDPEKWQFFLSDGLTRDLPQTLRSWPLLRDMLLHPWNTAMKGTSNADFIGVAYLALLPLPFLIKGGSRVNRCLAVFCLVMWVSWFTTTRMPRYFIPTLAVLAFLLADALRRARYAAVRWPLGVALWGIMFCGVQWAGFLMARQDGWQPVFGYTDEAAYLGIWHSTYPNPYYQAMEFVNKSLPADSRVLFAGETRSLYCRRRYIAPSVHDVHPLVTWARKAPDAEALQREVRANGVTHLFLNLSEAMRLRSYRLFQWDDRSNKVFSEWWRKHVKLVWQQADQRNPDKSLLFVYEITDSVPPGKAEQDLLSSLYELEKKAPK
jgi:hypothetical protein